MLNAAILIALLEPVSINDDVTARSTIMVHVIELLIVAVVVVIVVVVVVVVVSDVDHDLPEL